ncbi:hypothetical protein ACTXT7_010728 [Hymenolepis weldensis]
MILNYAALKKLQVSHKEHSVLLVESLLNPLEKREMIAQIMYEAFSVSAIYLINWLCQPYVGVTHTGPVYGSYALSHITKGSPFAGHGLNDFLGKTFCKRGFCFISVGETEDMKEKLRYVTLNYNSEMQKATKKSY